LLDVTKAEGFSLEDVGGLRSALETERSTVKTLNGTIKTFQGIDPTKAKDAIKKLSDLGDLTKLSTDDKVKQQIESIKAQLGENHTKAIGAITTEKDSMFKQLQKVMIDSTASKALIEAKVNTASIPLLLPHVRTQTKMIKDDKGNYSVEVIKPDGTTRISPSGSSNMSIAELATEFKEKYPQTFVGSGKSGMGGSPGDGSPGSGGHIISAEDAKDTVKYRAAKVAAEKDGGTLSIAEPVQESA